ncbi:hypothetical protein F4814DRAFT_456983 [Daldinia grandis]|nr:hypothetical protein F4814DRAFT_456983 [Daldinia grandis]
MATIIQSSAHKRQQMEQSTGSAASEIALIQPQRSSPEPKQPTVEPLTPIQTEFDTAASMAAKLRLQILINELPDASKQLPSADMLQYYLSQFPSPKRHDLLRFLEMLIQCCKELNATDQYEERQTPVPAAKHAQPSACSDDGLADKTEDSLANFPRSSKDRCEDSQSPAVAQTEHEDSQLFQHVQSGVVPEDIPMSTVEEQCEPEDELDEPEDDQRPPVESTTGVALESMYGLRRTARSSGSWNHLIDIKELAPEQVGEKLYPGGYDVENDHPVEKFVDPLYITRDMPDERGEDIASQDSPWPMLSPLRASTPDEPIAMSEALFSPSTSNGPVTAIPESHDSPSKYTTTTLVGSSRRDTPAQDKGTTPESTISSAMQEPYWTLVTQSDKEFATDSLEQTKDFSISGNSLDTYKHIFISLRGEQRGEKDNITYSDGSEWMGLVESGLQDRQKSSVLYALTAIGFCRWHADQVHLDMQTSGVSLKTATTTVTARILNANESSRDQRRMSMNTHLQRGRKWSKLVDKLSFGILFRYTWALGKANNTSLEQLVSSLQNSPVKMSILRHLEVQLETFLSVGRTNPDVLEQVLTGEKLLDRKLHIRDSTWGFYIDQLDRFNKGRWFGEDTIQLCMRLSDRLSFMRIGSPVAIHDEQTGKALADPLRWAAKHVEDWNVRGGNDHLVCFFPLFLENTHFTLLEINQVDGFIYHYDAAGYKARHIKTACKARFPNLSCVDQKIPGPNDSSSCGPLVVAMPCS